MPYRRYRRHFTPWRKNYAAHIAGLFFGTLALAEMVRRSLSLPFGLGAGAVCLGVSYWQWQEYARRSLGHYVEMVAQRVLRKAASQEGFDVRCNVPCPTGGDIDAIVTSHGRPYVVEIKSWAGVRLAGTGIVRVNGRPVTGHPLTQTLREARSVEAEPVLWLPRGNGPRAPAIFRCAGVLVVNGDASCLLRALD